MASPLGHVVVGVGVAVSVSRALGAGDAMTLWAGAAVAACLPDVDVLPSLWGVPYQRVHRQATHSFLILAPLVALCWVAVHALEVPADWRFMAAWTAALASHLVLDLLCTGPVLGMQGHGIPLFWPLSRRRWSVSRPMFPEVNLLEGFSPERFGRVCLRELIILTPAAGALMFLERLL